jgi:hypothetical protein
MFVTLFTTICLFPIHIQIIAVLSIENPFEYVHPIYFYVFQDVSFPWVSPPKPCVHLSHPPYVLHGQPISLTLFYHLNNTCKFWWIQVITLLIMQSLPSSSTSCFLSRNIFLRTIFSNILRFSKKINRISLSCVIASAFKSLLCIGNRCHFFCILLNMCECLDCICRSVQPV